MYSRLMVITGVTARNGVRRPTTKGQTIPYPTSGADTVDNSTEICTVLVVCLLNN